MKIKVVMMLSVAILIALSVTLAVYNWMQEKTTVLSSVETRPILVAASDLPWGTMLSKEMVKKAPFLQSSLPKGYFSEPAAVQGRTLLYPIKANEPLFESRMTPNTAQGGISAIISPKKRAMAIKVDKVVGVSGFIHPGNRVDVMVSLTQTGKVSVPITKTVLENVLVLAAGPEMEKSGSKEKPHQVDVITLEVTPEEGEMLALASTEGKLQLALRNSSDTGDVITKGATIPILLTSYASRAPSAVVKKAVRSQAVQTPAVPVTFSVEIVKGGKLSEMKFQKGE